MSRRIPTVPSTLLLLAMAATGAFSCLDALGQNQSMPFQLQDNLVRIPIRLNGLPAEAVLDSGTGGLVLDLNFARSLGMKPEKPSGTVPGGGAPVSMFPVTVAKLQFGPEALSQAAGVAVDLSHITSSACFPVQVLLGKLIFDQRALRIDYPDRRVVFLPPGEAATCTDPVPLSFTGGTPVVAVTLQATPTSQPVTLHLIVDLGTRHYAALIGGPFLNTEDGKILQQQGKSVQLGTGTGGAVRGTTVQLASLKVGNREFRNLTVGLTSQVGVFAAGAADGSLGVPLWIDGSITLDFPHRTLCLEKTANGPQMPGASGPGAASNPSNATPPLDTAATIKK